MPNPGKEKKEAGRKPEVDVEIGGRGLLGGFFKGLSTLVDLADKVTREGGEIKRTGEFSVKGNKDVTGVYGFSIRTMAGPGGGSRPVVQPFGDIGKVKARARSKGPVVEEAREPLIDLFDEEGFIRLVAELPGVGDADVSVEVQGDDVIQITTSGKRTYSKEVLLPAKVDPKSIERSYTNGVLEVKLKKAK
ncbi:MAG: Hsp20/alpha crystallin family protein [Nitrospirae bacterium]|nr:Hsp20/alpha crystallin family protein [Nitrospirota bacterium]